MLKIARSDEERRGGAVMAWLAGQDPAPSFAIIDVFAAEIAPAALPAPADSGGRPFP